MARGAAGVQVRPESLELDETAATTQVTSARLEGFPAPANSLARSPISSSSNRPAAAAGPEPGPGSPRRHLEMSPTLDKLDVIDATSRMAAMSLTSALSDTAFCAGVVTAVTSIPVSASLRDTRDRFRAFRWFSILAAAGITLILTGLALAGNWPGAILGAVGLAGAACWLALRGPATRLPPPAGPSRREGGAA